jgi:hypothetical protein
VWGTNIQIKGQQPERMVLEFRSFCLYKVRIRTRQKVHKYDC